MSRDSPRLSSGAVARIVAAYNVLLLTPLEYIPRALHVEFLKRGFAADVSVSLTLRFAKKPKVSTRDLVAIREVLRRSIAHLGTVESLVSSFGRVQAIVHSYSPQAESPFWSYLLASESTVESSDQDLVPVTMDLVDMYQG